MFKKLKSLFFVEEEPNELEVEVKDEKAEEIKAVIETQNLAEEETVVIQDLKKVEEKPVTFTLTPSLKQRIEERKQTQAGNYEFETILSPFSGRTQKKEDLKPKSKPVITKKEAMTFSNVISPMYGQTKKEEVVVEYEEEEMEEISLEELLSNKGESEPELVQFSLFESEKE